MSHRALAHTRRCRRKDATENYAGDSEHDPTNSGDRRDRCRRDQHIARATPWATFGQCGLRAASAVLIEWSPDRVDQALARRWLRHHDHLVFGDITMPKRAEYAATLQAQCYRR